MHPHEIKRLLGRNVLLEAIVEEKTESGLFIPLAGMARFPQIGRVVATSSLCEEGLRVGDVALLADEGLDTGDSYWKAMLLDLKDWKIEHCDLDECWQPISEAVCRYRKQGENCKVRVKTINGEWLSMDASDILDYGVEDLSHPGFRLEYVNCYIFWFEHEGLSRLFYIVSEKDILATLEIA